jgi:MYXO-CTERM domain-containing protein
MKQKRSRVIVGVGILCFVGVMAVWLASSGDRAIADAEQKAAVVKTTSQEMVNATAIQGLTTSQVAFAETEGVVHRLSVYLDIESADVRGMKVYLTSPSGTKVLLVDGARSTAVTKTGLKGWFGREGLATAESMAAFAGEPVAGAWKLTVDSKATGQLAKWSLNADLTANTKMAGMETYGEYGGDGGCDCRVASTGGAAAGGLLAGFLLIGLVLVRRRR